MRQMIKASLAAAALIGGTLIALPVLAEAEDQGATSHTQTQAKASNMGKVTNTKVVSADPCNLTNATTKANVKIEGSTAVGLFTIPKGCQSATVSLITSMSPNNKNGRPFSAQTRFKTVSVTAGPGRHELRAQLPDCFFQADLKGGPSMRTIAFKLGGSKPCHVGQGAGEAATPAAPAAVAPAGPLPATGADDGLALLGSGAVGYAAMAYRRSRMKLRQKLQSKLIKL